MMLSQAEQPMRAVENRFFSSALQQQNNLSSFFDVRGLRHIETSDLRYDFAEEEQQPDLTDPELEEAARRERDYVRQRLSEELKREPTEEEIDEWLRQHTEGY
jgi:hypothetical protein